MLCSNLKLPYSRENIFSPQWGNVVELPGNFRAIINQNKTYLIIYGNQDGTQHASKLILIKICAMEKN